MVKEYSTIMSSGSTTTITVLISVLLATSAFLVVATSQPTPQTLVTAEQAINILKESGKTNPMIINESSPESSELEYVSLNWTNYLRGIGSETTHSRIYVSMTPVGEIKPYWFISYGLGRYVVDAQTGELMLSLERVGGDITLIGPEYKVSTQPNVYLWRPGMFPLTPVNFTDHALAVKMGEYTPVILTITAEPYYNASLPVSIKVNNVPLDFYAGPNNATAILKTGGSVSFIVSVFTPVSYTTDFLPPPPDPHPHFNVEISFLGQTDSYPVYIVASNK